MPRKGYSTITVSEETYSKLAELARLRDTSIAKIVEELVSEYYSRTLGGEKEEGCDLDLVGEVGVSLECDMGAAPVIEVDEADHIIFKCSRCGEELVLLRISSTGWKTYLKMMCPKCGTIYCRKFYSTGLRGGARGSDIPRLVVERFRGSSLDHSEDIIRSVGEVVIASLANTGLSFGAVGDRVCIDEGVLEEDLVRRTLAYYGVSKRFFIDYPRASGDERLVLKPGYLCYTLDHFAESYARVVSKLLSSSGLKPVSERSGTLLYVIESDLVEKPCALMKTLYDRILPGGSGVVLRGVDVLRSLYYINHLGFFDMLIEKEEKMVSMLTGGEWSGFADLVARLEEEARSASRFGDTLVELWRRSRVVSLFVDERGGVKAYVAVDKSVLEEGEEEVWDWV